MPGKKDCCSGGIQENLRYLLPRHSPWDRRTPVRLFFPCVPEIEPRCSPDKLRIEPTPQRKSIDNTKFSWYNVVQSYNNGKAGVSVADQLAELFKVLGCTHRLQILREVSGQERCMCEIEPLLDIDKTTLSRHFKKLESAGLLRVSQEGTRKNLSLSSSRIMALLFLAEELLKEVHVCAKEGECGCGK